ncbi:MAG TPA: VOC family protein [Chitinophagaceae bacterium]|nr:VOC family protein [Chitinophagaceae bacterium]
MPQPSNTTFFAPMLYITDVAAAIEFYKKAFDAIELHRWSNEDGTVHVAELSIQSALFHIHEPVIRKNELSPHTLNGTAVAIGLFVEDVHGVVAKAVAAGAIETNPVTDYDYAYRQGDITDPFGHHWIIEKKI